MYGRCNAAKEAGCGGIIQDRKGKYKGGFYKSVGKCIAFRLELLGVLEGLRLTKKLEFCVDSKSIVKVLEKEALKVTEWYALVKQIKKCMELH